MPEELIIITDKDEGGKSVFPDPIKSAIGKFQEVKLDPAQIEVQMAAFIGVVGRIFKQATTEIPPEFGLQLEEVELAVKISAKGEVKLIAGGEATGEGAITLKFKRSDTQNNGK